MITSHSISSNRGFSGSSGMKRFAYRFNSVLYGFSPGQSLSSFNHAIIPDAVVITSRTVSYP
jgi:hypothetical protein